MDKETEQKKEITMNAGEANLKALIFAIPVFFVFVVPYFIIWKKTFFDGLSDIVFTYTFITLIFILAGAAIHELIHGLVWSFYLKKGFKSIKFGIRREHLTPYCHSKEPMKLKHYKLGAIMPGIILGVIPALISLLTGSINLFAFGVFFTLAAGGDLLMIWLLRFEDKNALVQDHPDKIGCYILTT